MAYPNPLATAAEILQAAADVLKRPFLTLNVTDPSDAGRYQRQAAIYAAQGYADLLVFWAARGYTASQVDTADQTKNWNRDVGVWYVLRDEANLPDGVKLQWQAEFDWRQTWKDAGVLTVGGVPVAGTNPLVGAAYVPFADKDDRWTRDSWF